MNLVAALLALFVLAAALLVAVHLRGLNRRLRLEMAERAQVEAALATSEKNYRELVDNANTIVLRMDVDGQDITESRQAQEVIRNMAFYDTLTKLPNRRLLLDRLRRALALSDRNGRYGALLFIDLDKFKQLNDTHGHDMGDWLLAEVARRLQACVREGDTVARLAGDEFVVMLEELDGATGAATRQVEAVAGKIVAHLGQPYALGDIEYQAGASVGIALFHDKKPSIDKLFKRADHAMYRAKAAGRNTWRFFEPDAAFVA